MSDRDDEETSSSAQESSASPSSSDNVSDDPSDDKSVQDALSSDASMSTPPRSRRQPAVRMRRDRQQRRQASKQHEAKNRSSNSAAPMSSTVSLWRGREKQFEKFRASSIVLPVPPTVVRVDKAKAYSLHIMSVLNWVLPDSILRAWSLPASRSDASDDDDNDELLVTVGVHVSLFHSASKRFFGNTWVSPEIAINAFQIKQDRHTKDNTIRYIVENVVLNFRAYFLSDVVDPNCVGICELVAYEKDPESKATISVVGCGWTILPLFTSSQSLAEDKAKSKTPSSAFAIGTSGEAVNVFVGSPRVLWELPATQWQAQEKQDQCKFYYQLVLYEPLLSIAMLLRKNELVGALESIPGLKNGNLANINVGKNPKLLLREDEDTSFEDALATFVKLASLVPKSIHIEENFTLHVIATRVAIHLREEIEANLVARLKISRKMIHDGAVSIDGEVSARVLKLGLHNGRCFRTRLHTIPLKVVQQGSDTLRCVTNQTKLKGFVLHPHMAIVVILQFTVHFRIAWPPKLKQQAIDAKKPLPLEEDVVLVTMGSRALVPSDGHKLYLYDKQHHATAEMIEPLFMTDTPLVPPGRGDEERGRVQENQQRRILHVEFLSGAPCRPYSDNPLYTPPNQGGKPLMKQGLTLKDSIAFVDLQLQVDGNNKDGVPSSPRSPIKKQAPPSPAKSAKSFTTNNNQRNDDSNDGDCSAGGKGHVAEHWAAKMLKKADGNSVLAHTLNALATPSSKVQEPSNQNEASKADPPNNAPSPSKKKIQNPLPADGSVPLLSQPQTTELSRASKTLLTRYGFMDAHDSSAVHEGFVSSSPLPNQQKVAYVPGVKAIDVELQDIYKAHEIRFHFAAYRAYTNVRNSPKPSRLYFTFQFYQFPPTRTETLRLSKPFDNGTGGEMQTFLLMRESPASKPSLAIQFDVDTTASMDPLEPLNFAEYMLDKSLYVDVWDADSLFQLGTFTIPLHELLRQGSGIKKFQGEADILPPLESLIEAHDVGGDESSAVSDIEKIAAFGRGHDVGVVGKVQFLISNYGLKGQNSVSQVHASSSAETARQSSTPLQGMVNLLQDGKNHSLGRVKHRVRARPLVDSNAELLRLLSQEGFYGGDAHRKAKRSKDHDEALRRERRKQQERSVSDATSLSPQEIAILCDLFGSNKKSASATSSRAQDNSKHRSTRIKCDREGQTGLLALVSLHPQAALDPQQSQQDANIQLERNAPVSKAEVPKKSISVVALHSDRLKRVLALMKANQVGLEKVFALFDLDKDGHLSQEEFVQALRSMDTVFADLSGDDLLAIVRAMDVNIDGRIDYKEFVAFVASSTTTDAGANKSADQWQDEIKRILIRAKEKGIPIHKIFADLDASGDGNLSYDEFGQALRKLGVSEEHVAKNRTALMAAFDKDNDEQISYEEFLQTLGISVEANKADAVKANVQDIDATVRETFKRLDEQGVGLAQVFVHFDKDKNGTLSVEEFTEALMQLLHRPDPKASTPSTAGTSILQALERESIHAYVKKINPNGDDVIDYREFLTLCGVTGTALKQQSESFRVAGRVQAEKKLIKLLVRAFQANITIEQVFAQFDANADGKITVAEFRKSLAQLFQNQGLTQEDMTVITSRFDENGDGDISFPEFQRFGCEIQANQQTLMDIFLPHIQKVADVEKMCSKLPLGKWQTLCSKDLKLPKQQMDAIKPLLSYFELMDATKKVDLTQLCALLVVPPAPDGSNSSSNVKKSEDVKKKADGVTRLRDFLLKARSMGVNTNAMFAEFDANGDGEITREEFKSILQKLGRFDDISEKELDAMMMELDEDQSAKISLREFKTLVGKRDDATELLTRFAKLLDEAAKHGFTSEKCFAHFDKDGGGKISKDEFVNGMIELGFGADESTLNDIFGNLDRDASGEICYKKFKQLFPRRSEDARLATDESATEAAVLAEDVVSKQPDSDSAPASKPSDSVKPAPTAVTTRDRLRALLQQAELSGHDVSACFAHFDGDGDGKITTEEFSQGMKALAGFEDVATSDLQSLVSELDKGGSGSVSLDEFKAFVRNSSEVTLKGTAEASGASQEEKNEYRDGSNKIDDSKLVVEGQESRQNEDMKEAAHHTAKLPTEAQPDEGASGGDGKETTKDEEAALAITTTNDECTPSANPSRVEDNPALKESAIPKPGRKPAVRSSSFVSGRGKPPSFAIAKQRTNTDSSSIAAAVDDASVAPAEASVDQAEEIGNSSKKPVIPQHAPSFAAARAAKAAAARKAASSTQPDSAAAAVSEAIQSSISVGLEKLRTLLQTAQEQGVDIQVSFDHFDEDKNGKLTYTEFSRGLKKLGGEFSALTDEQVDGMAKEVDRQQQGEIIVQDLVKLISSSPSTALTSAETVSPPSASTDNAATAADVVAPNKAEKAVPGAKPAPASARAATTDPLSKGAPVRRTSSLRSAPKKAAPSTDSVAVVASKPAPALQSQVVRASIAAPGTANISAASSARVTTEDQPSRTAQGPPNDVQPAQPSGTESVVPPSAIGEMDGCAYSFHSDPRIRAVELKLRRAAMDAYSRGILPLRVISKFLDHESNGQRMHRDSRKTRDELLRVEFLQVLMELGFSLLSDTQDDDNEEKTRGSGAPQPMTRMNDYLYARQLERLSRYKHHISEETKAQKQLVRAVTKTKRVQHQQQQQAQRQKIAAEDSLRRFAEEKNQLLRVLSYYRDGQKKSLVYSLIRDQVTTMITLTPSFGALVFCELSFQNPYNHHERFRIEIVLPPSSPDPVLLDVDLVKNGAEWAFYRENVPLAYGGGSDTSQATTVLSPVEQEMIDDHNEVVMDAHDRIPVPLRLRWLDATTYRVRSTKAQGNSAGAIPVSVVVRSCTHGHTVALFKVQLQPRPMICHRVLRFSHPSGSIWRWQMRYPRGKYLVCMDPSIVVDGADGGENERQLVGFKCRVGEYPSLEEFYVVLYDDKYYAKVYEIWQFRVQAKLRVDIHAVMGQRAKNELIIRGDHAAAGGRPGSMRRHVKCFTTWDHAEHMQFRPSQVFQLVPQAFNRIEFAFCSTEQLTGCRVLVNLVDVDTHELVGAWIVHVSISLPLITKTYDLRLPLGQHAQKKIAYANPWEQSQTILLRSSMPALLKPRDAVLQIPSNGNVFLRLGFAPVTHKTRETMYLFINDKQTDQNEECLLFQVTYE
uniref:EF-hand domain-containing protein n=1 Tax=Globisporangium ultimum (strain ATCC 200006 / CBS 805.95 / DAOM BR144) TaxID=431595 RepID=K3W8N0_GLOUD